MRLGNVCLLMNAPATTEDLPYHLEKLSMKIGLYGK